MRKFLSYMFAGALVSSLSVLACSSDSTRDDGDDDDTTSSSSGAAADGGSSSGKTGSSSSGGGSSSGGSSSSSGGAAFDVEVSDFTVTPAVGTVGTEVTHTFTMKYTGTLVDGVAVFIAPKTVPTGVTQANLGISGLEIDQEAPAGTLGGSFKFNPSTAGDYVFQGGVDGDGNQQTTDDVAASNDFTVTISAAD